MSSTFQIVQPDGRVGAKVSLEDIVSEVAHGRLLSFDFLRAADGAVSSVSEHAACARIVKLLEQRSTAGTAAALAKQIGTIATHGATVRLLTWDPDSGAQRAFWFRDGFLVGGRTSVKSELPEATANESAEQRSHRAVKLIEVLGHAMAPESVRFSVIEDHAIKNVEIVAWFPARSALEAALLEGLSSSVLLDRVELFGTLERGPIDATHAVCDPTDQALTKAISNTTVSADSVASLSRQHSLDQDVICARLQGLVAVGVLKGSVASAPALRRRAQRLGEQNYFERLEIEAPASAEAIAEAYARRIEALGAVIEADDTPAIRQARQEIAGRLEIARDTLSNEHDQAIYGRALELRVDHGNPAVRERLMREHLTALSKRSLNQQDYETAVSALERLERDHPSEESFPIQLGWAQFLMSERTPEAADKAVAVVQRALKINTDSDDAYVTMGKIYSFADMTEKAKKALRTATEINGNNSEAWALRRRLNAKRTGRGQTAAKIQLDVGQGLKPGLVFAFMVLALLYAAANVVPGGAKEWPRVGGQAAIVASKQASQYETDLARQVQERLKGKIDYRVPSDNQVLGNVESYYLVDDPWFWGRRIILILCALLGIFGIARSVLGDLPLLGHRPILMFVALPYGVIVGFLSPLPSTPSPLEYLLAMTFVHVLAEQLFFFGFIGRMLTKSLDSPVVALGLTAVIFGAHQLTYYATLQLEPTLMFQGIAQMAAFAGGAYAVLWWVSGGLLAPFIAHFLINGLMMFRAVQLFSA